MLHRRLHLEPVMNQLPDSARYKSKMKIRFKIHYCESEKGEEVGRIDKGRDLEERFEFEWRFPALLASNMPSSERENTRRKDIILLV